MRREKRRSEIAARMEINMITDDYNILINVLNELKQEVLKLDTQIECNSRYIKEADVYLKEFAEPEDFRVFSPRNMEMIHKEEIKRTTGLKEDYVKQNEQLNQKRDVLSARIKKLEKILNREDHKLTVLKIQEEDRKRIARELHDTSLQNLTHLIHKIELCGMYIDTDPVQAKLELSVVNKHLKETIDEIRGTIFDLRPMTFDDLGMKAALERLLININKNNRFEINSVIEDVSCETNMVMVSIYRIIQESLINIVKHSEAKKIEFSFRKINEQFVAIDIKDDGKGFIQEEVDTEKHFGILLMKERVDLLSGDITITSEEGIGTEIHIEIPLNCIIAFG